MQHLFAINRNKAEAPAAATFFIVAMFSSIAFYPTFLWGSFLLFPMLAIIYLILRKLKISYFKRQCFIFIDDTGIKYCLHIYQRPVFIAWEQIARINYQLYETNIQIASTGEVISIQVGYLQNPEDFEIMKGILDAKMLTK
jgi:hypothetical protein